MFAQQALDEAQHRDYALGVDADGDLVAAAVGGHRHRRSACRPRCVYEDAVQRRSQGTRGAVHVDRGARPPDDVVTIRIVVGTHDAIDLLVDGTARHRARALAVSGETLRAWWFAPAPAERLAALRIAIGAYALVYVLARGPELISIAQLHRGSFDAIGVTRILSSRSRRGSRSRSRCATVVLLVLFTLGIAYRDVAPLARSRCCGR